MVGQGAHESLGETVRGKGFRRFSLQMAGEGKVLADSDKGLAGGGQEELAQVHSPEIFPAMWTPMVTPKPKPKLTPRKLPNLSPRTI